MAQVFLTEADVPDQIARVLRSMALSSDFAAPSSKLCRPFEFLAALYRAAVASVTADENSFQCWLGRAGLLQHSYGPRPATLTDWRPGPGPVL